MENGLRTLNIASLNPDPMRGKEMQREIVKGITKNKIQIAAIQETHITQDMNYMVGNYRIITAAGKSAETGIVDGGGRNHDTREPATTHNADRRTKKPSTTSNTGPCQIQMPIHIISTYAPHNGHTEEEKDNTGEM